MTDDRKHPFKPEDDNVIEAEAEIVGQESPRHSQSYQYYGPRGQSRVFVYRSEGCNCSCCLGCLLFVLLILAILGSMVF